MDFRLEYPRPELKRESWLSLNGVWEFDLCDGREREDFTPDAPLSRKINIPFCPESTLSGIGDVKMHSGAMYKRSFHIPEQLLGKRVILHIGACDFLTRVYINGQFVGAHAGGYTPFSFDITDSLCEGENSVFILVLDDVTSKKQMSGKQSAKEYSYGCFYTRTTGIWQSVWLEAVNEARVISYTTDANIRDGYADVTLRLTDKAIGHTLSLAAYYEGKAVGTASEKVTESTQKIRLPLSETHLWEIGCGRLYDLKIELFTESGEVCDSLDGYFGMREVKLLPDGFYLNGKKVFLRFVLDQGFYPDGIYTAPSDEALKNDIKSAITLGFNGARMHQKLFEPRYIYHADKLGFMLFGESACWGLDYTDIENKEVFFTEWCEALMRDSMHPSIIAWCPFNETWDIDGKAQCDEMIDGAYYLTKKLDRTRPVITNSGSYPSLLDPAATDAFDVHDYEQDPKKFRACYLDAKSGIVKCQLWRQDPERQKYNGKPIFMSEYGGIKWTLDDNESKKSKKEKGVLDAAADTEAWGYGDVRSEREFLHRLEGLTDAILENDAFFGFCYTQLYDVEQEQNGLLTYERESKFPPEAIRKILAKERKIQ